MTRDEFEQLIAQAVEELPSEFKEKLDNVSIVLEKWPTPDQLRDAGISHGGTLLGLYHGTPQSKRTSGTIYPDKISIFAGPILMVARTPEDIRAKVRQVVRHEIAHHFGMDEERIRKRGY